MSSKKISALDAAGTITGAEQVPVVQGGETKRTTQEELRSIPQTQAEIDAGVTPSDLQYPVGNILRYGAVGDDSTDNTTAIQNAIDVAAQSGSNRRVIVPEGTFRITSVLLLTNDVMLVGEGDHRISAEVGVIKKTTNTQSAVTATRSGSSTNFGDGFDGADHTPNCVIHCVANKTTDGSCQTFIQGIGIDGNGVCDYGIYGSRLPQSTLRHNFIDNCSFGILIYNSIFIGEVSNNVVRTCERGIGIDNGTSLGVHTNFVKTYSVWAYHIEGLKYGAIHHNAADNGAEGETTSYAYAYRFRNLDGCHIYSNGAEFLNGIFMFGYATRNCTIENNFVLAHEFTYTGGDNVAIWYLDNPLGKWANNRAIVLTTATGSATRFNVFVENELSQNNYEWSGNMVADNDSGFSTDVSTVPEGYGRVSVPGGNYGTKVDDIPSDITLFVRSGGGDANNGLGGSGNAVQTVQQLIDRLPKHLNKEILIDIASENITEDVVIEGFDGRGRIQIDGNGSGSWTGSIRSRHNTVAVEISDFELTPTGSAPGAALEFSDADGLVHGIDYNTSATGDRNFVLAQNNANVGVYGNTYTTPHNDAISAQFGAEIILSEADRAQMTSGHMEQLSGGRITLNLEPFDLEETAANIADATATINTTDKYIGREVWDTTNLRRLRASGAGSTDTWDVVDGSASVTPA